MRQSIEKAGKGTLALLALLMAGAAPAMAGEYDKVSAGIMVDYSYSTSQASVPFQNASGNIQGANTQGLLGIGLVAVVRPAEIISAKLSSFNLVPSVSLRYGTSSNNANTTNLNFYATDGSQVSIQDAASSRKTTTVELAFVCPIRWYPGNSSVNGGLYLEAGPGFDRSQKAVQLDVSGDVQSVPSSLSESTTITSTTSIMHYGIGWTTTYAASQASFGFVYQGATKANSGVSNQIRLVLQWVF